MAEKINVIGYLRPSKGMSLDAQDAIIRRYAELNGMCITKCVTDGEGACEALEDLVRGNIGNPPIKAVLAARNDRIAGDINRYYYYKFLLARKNMGLVVAEDNFDEAAKKVLEDFIVTAGREEIENGQQKRRAGQMAKARDGGYAGGRAPYGYDAVRGSGMLILNEKEAVMIRRIFELHDEYAFTYRAIAEVIAKEKWTTRTGKPIHPSTIASIVGNRKLYEGYIKFGSDSWMMGKHQKILG